MKTTVYEYLQTRYGRANAIPSKTLAKADRTGTGGRRCDSIRAAESAQRALDAATGQKSIAGWYE